MPTSNELWQGASPSEILLLTGLTSGICASLLFLTSCAPEAQATPSSTLIFEPVPISTPTETPEPLTIPDHLTQLKNYEINYSRQWQLGHQYNPENTNSILTIENTENFADQSQLAVNELLGAIDENEGNLRDTKSIWEVTGTNSEQKPVPVFLAFNEQGEIIAMVCPNETQAEDYQTIFPPSETNPDEIALLYSDGEIRASVDVENGTEQLAYNPQTGEWFALSRSIGGPVTTETPIPTIEPIPEPTPTSENIYALTPKIEIKLRESMPNFYYFDQNNNLIQNDEIKNFPITAIGHTSFEIRNQNEILIATAKGFPPDIKWFTVEQVTDKITILNQMGAFEKKLFDEAKVPQVTLSLANQNQLRSTIHPEADISRGIAVNNLLSSEEKNLTTAEEIINAFMYRTATIIFNEENPNNDNLTPVDIKNMVENGNNIQIPINDDELWNVSQGIEIIWEEKISAIETYGLYGKISVNNGALEITLSGISDSGTAEPSFIKQLLYTAVSRYLQEKYEIDHDTAGTLLAVLGQLDQESRTIAAPLFPTLRQN